MTYLKISRDDMKCKQNISITKIKFILARFAYWIVCKIVNNVINCMFIHDLKVVSRYSSNVHCYVIILYLTSQ